MVDAAKGKTDAIHLAAEVGRLDVVSLLLSFFGILLAVLSVMGFLEIRWRAKQVASEEAKAETSKIMNRFLNEEAPPIIRSHVEWLVSPTGGNQGDKIAANFGTGAENDETGS